MLLSTLWCDNYKNPSRLQPDPSLGQHIGPMEKERVLNTCQALSIQHYPPKMYLICHQRESGSILLALLVKFYSTNVWIYFSVLLPL